jgi:CDGSH-type Zn-finger protein
MTVRIRVRATGPYVIEGDPSEYVIVDHEGNPIPIPEGKKNVVLCRCGASSTKPFCDTSHKLIGFMGAQHPPGERASG